MFHFWNINNKTSLTRSLFTNPISIDVSSFPISIGIEFDYHWVLYDITIAYSMYTTSRAVIFLQDDALRCKCDFVFTSPFLLPTEFVFVVLESETKVSRLMSSVNNVFLFEMTLYVKFRFLYWRDTPKFNVCLCYCVMRSLTIVCKKRSRLTYFFF